jgi:integrase
MTIMAKLFKRKDGRYSAQVFVGVIDGKRKYKTVYGETQSEVKQKVALITADVSRGIYAQDEEMNETDDISHLTVGEFLLEWLDSVDTVKINTRISYEGIVRNHLIPSLGSIKLQELEPREIQRMLNELNNKGLSTRTQRYVLTVLRMALKHARVLRLLESNPSEGLKLTKPKKDEIVPLDVEQVSRLLTAAKADRQLYLALLLAISTGARAGEIWAIEWEDIDFGKATLRIRHTLNRRTKELTHPKTESSIRTVALTEKAMSALRQYKEEQARQRTKATEWHDSYDLVFRTSIGTPIDHSHFIQRKFNPLLESLNNEGGFPKIRFHDLRNTAATLLLNEGENIKVIAEMLGHKDASMTADVYSHSLPNMQREAAKKMNNLLKEENHLYPVG